MRLSVDIGNSTIAFGLFDSNSQIVSFFKIKKDEIIEENTAAEHIKAELSFRSIKPSSVKAVYISSVAPSVTGALKSILKAILTSPISTLSLGSSKFIDQSTVNPELGCDIYANAVAARFKHPDKDIILVDYGTASTTVAVDRFGRIKGVSIAAGVYTSLSAICSKAELLAQAMLTPSALKLGNTTQSAISSGAMFSSVGMLECIVKNSRDLFEDKPFVIVTGGAGGLIADCSSLVDEYDEYNTVLGILKCLEG